MIAIRQPIRADVSNEEIANRLLRISDLLESQGAGPFRVRAYRAAAASAREYGERLAEVGRRGGRRALERVPAIGRSISALIEELVETGRIGLLERLEGHVSPEDIFSRVPGIGETLAARIHETLGIETLEDLEAAAHDGRLAAVPGFGPRRVESVRDVLDARLRRRVLERRGRRPPIEGEPPVSLLLRIDAEYRARAEAGELRTIAPRRFNPTGRDWLPIFHTSRGRWHFTALYSNTALAHRLGRTHDWVVIYYENDGDEGQCTVVTEREGLLEGWRVVRGREDECLDLYASRHGWSWARQRGGT